MWINKKVITFFVLISTSFSSHALLIWDWDLEKSTIDVTPSNTITLNATIYNDASSTQSIFSNTFITYGMGWGSIFGPGNPYTYSSGVDGWLLNQFIGVEVAPGDSFDFVFATLTPKNGLVDVGIYTSDYLMIAMKTDNIQLIKSVEINVNTIPVPEPSTIALLCIGLFGILLMRARNKI